MPYANHMLDLSDASMFLYKTKYCDSCNREFTRNESRWFITSEHSQPMGTICDECKECTWTKISEYVNGIEIVEPWYKQSNVKGPVKK